MSSSLSLTIVNNKSQAIFNDGMGFAIQSFLFRDERLAIRCLSKVFNAVYNRYFLIKDQKEIKEVEEKFGQYSSILTFPKLKTLKITLENYDAHHKILEIMKKNKLSLVKIETSISTLVPEYTIVARVKILKPAPHEGILFFSRAFFGYILVKTETESKTTSWIHHTNEDLPARQLAFFKKLVSGEACWLAELGIEGAVSTCKVGPWFWKKIVNNIQLDNT